jgi:uncharacterized protein (TIRG00374 family)
MVSFSTELPKWVIGAGLISLGMIAAIFLIILLMILKESLLLRFAERILRPFSHRALNFAQDFITSFSRGARILIHWPIMVWAFSCSIFLWSAMAMCNYIMFLAFSFSLSWVAAFVLLIIVDLGLMIPTAPGFVGSFQFFFIVGLALFGVGREQALSFAILSHAVQFLFVSFSGLIFFPMVKIRGVHLWEKIGTFSKN